jgi:hypothetical protein
MPITLTASAASGLAGWFSEPTTTSERMRSILPVFEPSSHR